MDTENKGGRPRKEIEQKEFEKLCSLQCTEVEICEWFGVSDKTLANWCRDIYGMGFSEVFEQKRSAGKIALRRSMFQLAQKNATMAIFLAKNWLGMTDNVEIKADTSLMQSLVDIVQGKQEIAETEPVSEEDLKNYIL